MFVGLLIAALSMCSYLLWVSNCSLRDEKAHLQTELSDTQLKLQESIATQIKIQEYNTDLIETSNLYRLRFQDLQSKLSHFESRANAITKKHPKLISNAVNTATKKVNDCFEKISVGGECDADK